MKKILMLGDINSPHIQKWLTGVASLGYQTAIFSISSPENDWYSQIGIRLLSSEVSLVRNFFSSGKLSKIGYLSYSGSVKDAIKLFTPDIIHAHYATSYGMLGALTNFHPYIISVWGSDVFDFPRRSIFHRWLLQWNFKKADLLLSTSHAMKQEISKYTDKNISITPFGIDLDKFNKTKIKKNEIFTIGIIKSLEDYYGIEYLIRAFEIVSRKYHNRKLKLMIVGDGSGKEKFQNLVRKLNLSDHVEFAGKIIQDDVPDMHNRFDVFVCPSLSESFGVSVLEASACEVPVIVTNVGGLKEVVIKNETGLVVNPKNPGEIADAISYFIDKPEMIELYGKKGRKFVSDNFNWKNNLTEINDIYKQF